MLSASLIQLEYASKQWKSTFSYYPQPVFHCLQAVGAHVLAELEAPGHAAFALGVAVAVVLVPQQPTQ